MMVVAAGIQMGKRADRWDGWLALAFGHVTNSPLYADAQPGEHRTIHGCVHDPIFCKVRTCLVPIATTVFCPLADRDRTLLLPVTLEHTIDERSPLYRLSAQALQVSAGVVLWSHDSQQIMWLP